MDIALPDHLMLPRLRRPAAAEYLRLAYGINVKKSTMAKWATHGEGPTYDKWGRFPLYTREELDRWARAALGGKQ